LLKYTKEFDKVELQNIVVTKEEIEEAFNIVPNDFIDILNRAIENIKAYHQKQVKNSWMFTKDNGVLMGQKVMPLDKVGVYVPGGTAAYPSSVLMNVIPAKIAGVDKIYMVTPPKKDGKVNPYILAAAKLVGVDEIFKVGGAQAVAALSFGTETIPKVDKIVGPGNIFVALAKKLCYGVVDIDMIAGPSEILIISDEKSNPRFLAADLMSQAEHDRLASSVLITTSEDLANEVKRELEIQIETLERKDIIEDSLKRYGGILIVSSLEEAVNLSNLIAPEHLELMVENPFELLGKIKHAGSIFMGAYCPEPLGDYMAGPNHVLPTTGTARFYSPLSVDDFVKKSSFLYYPKEALSDLKDDIIKFTEYEGLTAHGNSIKVRF
ncbi:MAG: histidinol dehydrogenase, partial [Oscillospiraceae bacterium]|nr:histidinol dehydrogenase [Oscillospiraceae bacterium]